MKYKSLLLLLLLWSIPMTAKEHTIERGETIESIASSYGLSVQDIITANPGLDDMFFSGMVINIPEKSVSESTSTYKSPVSTSVPSSSGISEQSSYNSNIGNPITASVPQTQSSYVENDGVVPSDFDNFYLTYFAPFEGGFKGNYGYGYNFFFTKGIGLMFGMYANYGIFKEGKGLGWQFGPQYGYVIHPNIMIDLKMKGFVQYYDFSFYDKLQVTGGILFTPEFLFRLGRVKLGVGYNLGFESSKNTTAFTHSLQLTLGI